MYEYLLCAWINELNWAVVKTSSRMTCSFTGDDWWGWPWWWWWDKWTRISSHYEENKSLLDCCMCACETVISTSWSSTIDCVVVVDVQWMAAKYTTRQCTDLIAVCCRLSYITHSIIFILLFDSGMWHSCICMQSWLCSEIIYCMLNWYLLHALYDKKCHCVMHSWNSLCFSQL